jgi:hypothetical protein
MKKIKSLLILGAFLLVGLASFSQSITYRFNNYKIVPAAGPDTLIFDVEAKSNVGTTYTTTFSIKVNFNNAVFGVSAIPVVVEQLVLSQPTGYNLNTLIISTGTSRFASTFQAFRLNPPHNGTFQTAFLSNLTTEYQGVVRYKMLITGTGNAGIDFFISGGGSMQTGQNYVLTSGGTTTTPYSPITAENNLLTLPTNPNLSLMFSELGAPGSPDNFVEVYNAGASTLDFDNHFAWYLSIDGSSSTKLTGTLAPGAAYAIDIASTSGNAEFLLSTYGDYVDGTAIDYYDGGLAGFDFTGAHAVRHYDIVSPNLVPDLTEWVISAGQAIDMTPGSHRADLNWSGADAAWRDQANWAEGFIPDAGHNVIIPNSGVTPMISNGMNAYANDLSIGSAGLVIESDMTNGDGSLITYGAVSGTASVQRYLGADRFWYITQPVTSATANVFLHTWLFTYNEGSSDWDAFIEDETTPLGVMKGFAVWTSSSNKYDQDLPPLGDTTTAYDGVLNSGAISTPLTSGGDGWNFVGNPYPSAVDWDAAGWTRTNLATNAYYVWNGSTYASYLEDGPGTNGGTQYIPAAQGFFVQASAAGTLGVSNAVRTHSTQDFWKSDENRMNLLSLTVSNGEVNDETVICFNTEATPELDYSFDARKLMAPGSPQAFTMMGTDKMAVNSFNNTTQTPSVVLGVNTPAEGEYTLTASNLESFDVSTPVYLEDVLTGQKVNLREMSTYTFSSGEGTSERFVVHFAEYQGIGDKLVSEVNNIYAVNQVVYVDFSAVKGEISIYNILGQEISRTAASNGLNMISVPQGNAVYIVKVISDNTTVTKKVFVK